MRLFLRCLWLPGIWLFLTMLDMIVFASGKPTSVLGKLFESFVFVSSFLIYAMQWQLREVEPIQRVILPATAQFLFWWLMAYGGTLVVQKIKKQK